MKQPLIGLLEASPLETVVKPHSSYKVKIASGSESLLDPNVLMFCPVIPTGSGTP
jgi:hypothetical protein